MAMTVRSFRSVLRSLVLLFALGVAVPALAAPAITVSPGMGRQGASLSVSASGLAASTTYSLEYAGSSTVAIGTGTSDLRGYLRMTRTLPALPAGRGRMQLRSPDTRIDPAGRIVATTPFVALTPITFVPSTTRIHAGQTLGYTVGNLTTGYLTILYEGRSVVGPVAVAKGSYTGKFLVPTDRPAPLPADADIRIVNSVGRTTVGTLDAVLPVRAKLLSPFRIGISTPPPTQVKPSQRFAVNGTFQVEENEAAPEDVSLWYFGNNGEVFPLGAGQASTANGQSQYGFQGAAGGTGAMTAGVVAAGTTAFVAGTKNQAGVRGAIVQQPSNATFNALPDDRWRLRVRVLKQGSNTPVAGAVVQFEGAPVAGPEADDDGPQYTFTSAQQYAMTSTLPSQISRLRATDDQGCPLTLARQLTDAQGYATFEFTDDQLRLAAPKRIPTNPGQFATIGVQMIGIDASAQGYGFQFPANHPTNPGDFLPHIYEVQFGGVGDGVPDGDTITFVDYYQDVQTGAGSRDYTYTLVLPQMQPGVALYDTAIKPWIAHIEAGPSAPNSGPFPPKNLAFGPINSKYGIPADWIDNASTPYPTQVTVRTDPAVTGAISSAKLYLDMDRNGLIDYVTDFDDSPTALDCTISGLDSSLTWRANFPNVQNARAGRIKGYVEFISQTGGKAKQKISIDVRERDLSWLAAPAYGTSQDVEFRAGGQIMVVGAVEDSPDADVQLDRDPGYEIGRLRNETENTRVVDMLVDMSGHMTVNAPLDGAHQEAGRGGAPTLLEPAPGVDFFENYTLIDQSFPLFYYVWGVPLLAGIELGADFNILAEIDIAGEFIIKQETLQPSLTVTTTPQLDLGLNFYVDIDVLFDLVDGGVDLDAIFELDMPIAVVDNVAGPPRPCFTASLLFSWHFEVFCLPLDFVCDALNDIEGSETLLSDRTGSGCSSNTPSFLADGKAAKARQPARIVSNQSVVAYSPAGAGFMAFTRDDSNGSAPRVLVARPADGGSFDRTADDVVLSTQPGIRSIDIAFYDDHAAVMVWAESADDYPTLAAKSPRARLARQRLMFATWDGERWSAKQQLTAPAGGEGGVDLAACPDGATGCPVGGAVLAAWTRDVAGDITQHRTRIFNARYAPGTGWTTPTAVDASAAAILDSSPSASWVGGQPLVVFVRSTSGAFADTDARRVAYRFVGSASPVQVPAGLPGGVAWPSAVATGPNTFTLVHTHAHDPKSFVGNTQRVALANASACSAGTCTMQAQPVSDPYGRPVFGERPTAVVEADGEVTVTMRGVGFGSNASGVQTRPEDPIGMALHTGDLVSFQATPGRSVIAPIALTNDGRGHFAPSVAFDPVLKQAVVASTLGAQLPAGLRAKYAKSGAVAQPARAKGVLAEPDLEVMGVATGVDLRIEQIVPAEPFVAGAQVLVRTVVRNVGTTYTESGAKWLFRFGWDAPHDAGGTLVGAGEVTALLRPGESRLISAIVTVPASYKADQPHALFATLVRNGSNVEDINGENNVGEYHFGGMPKPFGLNATAIPGANVVQLTWEAVPNPNALLGGYRVWHHDGDGVWKHLGSSFENGFIDLAPLDGVERSYRVTSYSKNAVESEASDVASAKVVVDVPGGGGPDALFQNGFE